MVRRLNPMLRGWANYFRVANSKKLSAQLMDTAKSADEANEGVEELETAAQGAAQAGI